MKIRPSVGSISRLIIFIVVVFPHPDGPTSITISPAGMVRSTWSTAGAFCRGYRLVHPSRTICSPCPEPRPGPLVSVLAIVVSDTDTPRGGEAGDQVEHDVEDDREHEDSQGARHDVVGCVGTTHPRDAREDVAAQSGAQNVGRDRRDPHEHLTRYPHAGHDHRPGEWK